MAGFTLFGPTHHLLTASVRLRVIRHELLTANIANADTPGYRPRDLDFAGVLRALVLDQRGRGGGEFGKWDTEKLTLTSRHSHGLAQEREGEGRLDGNRVDLDRELALLVENTLLHEASLTLLSRTLGGLRYAISEGKR
jgi:flagellar basal-body rod protein FlgB